ncbi:MAG: NAD(P)-dependent oxidoreductase [bacterium]
MKKAASIDEVLKTAHFVSLHVPLTAGTRNLVDHLFAGDLGMAIIATRLF